MLVSDALKRSEMLSGVIVAAERKKREWFGSGYAGKAEQ